MIKEIISRYKLNSENKYFGFSKTSDIDSKTNGVVYAPFVIETMSKEDIENRRKIDSFVGNMDDDSLLYTYTTIVDRMYRLAHKFCPNCGSGNISQTCVGYIPHIEGETLLEKARSYVPHDPNRATCQICGYIGNVENLIDEESAKKLENYDK